VPSIFPEDRRRRRLLRILQTAVARDQRRAGAGVAFGAGGEGSIRYAAERAILEQAMVRLKMFLESAK
jgi:hypothetical protein